ncbi:sucrose-phosphatase 2-like isoform X2 [Tripterygium wilfordii]|uniref:sucrose-phosphatase 2-like isoform X2 n=1 Tax=Tripterygium wilfordii TaxID=458696 RepID=UPI0018F845D3|nr:sucrose-phosphatase 2-like isoform X2 [Tripterygium wilfordii]
MDLLSAAGRLMIVSDLDLTMVDHEDPENLSLLRFNALWEACYRQDSLLVYSSGRSPASYKKLRKNRPLLTPDITIMSVGTEIMYGESMVRDDEWERYLNQRWNRDIVMEETAKFPQLTPQSETAQRPLKVSFFVKKDVASKVMKALAEQLEKHGVRIYMLIHLLFLYQVLYQILEVKIVYSSGMALDILPKGAGKGQALLYLFKKFHGNVPVHTLVCGDSGNDAELFGVPGVYGVMVSNAQEELLQWFAENAKDNPNLIHATERCASGIIQAIGHFSLGPNVSPRDITDFQKCKLDIFNPSYEVVKFYLLYERWQRAEVEKSEQYMENLKLIFYPAGIFVHPSGVERSMHQFIDEMGKSYGSKRRMQYHIWLDRVSSAQIGSDTWLVKFDKWESSGKERHCCLTMVLLSSTGKVPDAFTWLHVHQTWLDGSEPKGPTTWLL